LKLIVFEDCNDATSLSATGKIILLRTVICALCVSFLKIFFSKVFEYIQLFRGLAENKVIIEKTFFVFTEFLDNVKLVRISFFKEFSVFAFLMRIFMDFFKKKI
jgi:hypothetical protein